jgi:hypothetical protein
VTENLELLLEDFFEAKLVVSTVGANLILELVTNEREDL